MLRPLAVIRSSLAAQQPGHRLLVGECAGTTCGGPFPVRSESCLYLGVLQELGRGTAFSRPQPPQLRERDEGGSLAAQVDHLIGLVRVRVAGCAVMSPP